MHGADMRETISVSDNKARPLVRCSHCDHPQELMFKQLRWPQSWKPGDSPGEVYYECEQCRGAIREEDRPRLNALYLKSFAEVAEAFLCAKTSPEAMRFFVEQLLDEEWEELPARTEKSEPAADDRVQH